MSGPRRGSSGEDLGCLFTLLVHVAFLALIVYAVNQLLGDTASVVTVWVIILLYTNSDGISRRLGSTRLVTRWRDRRATARRKREEAARLVAPCKHGVRGGQETGRCAECRLEQERTEREQRERERRQALERQALALERAETNRIASARRRRMAWLTHLSPRQFEQSIAELYGARGFEVTLTPCSNDEGRDVIAVKGERKLYIECKRYAPRNLVGRPALQKLVGAIDGPHTEAVFVTTSGFSGPAMRYATERHVTLIDGHRLDVMMRETFPDVSDPDVVKVACLECGAPVEFPIASYGSDRPCPRGHRVCNRFDPKRVEDVLDSRTPRCRSCGEAMVRRTGRRGAFWGCPNYPRCRYMQRLRG